jgi:hypothetical protein
MYPHTLVAEWTATRKTESLMNTREKTNTEALNDEALDRVAGGIWDDGGCTPNPLAEILKHILHPPKPGGPINAR